MNKSHIIAIALGILITTGAVFYHSKNTVPTDKIFSQVIDKISSQKFIREKIDGNFILKDDSAVAQNNLPAGVYPNLNFSLTLIGSLDNWINYSGDAKASINIKLRLENFMKDAVSAEADLIMPEMMLYYIKLVQLTGVPMDISSIKGQWWKVDIEALAKNFAGVNADKILESAKNNGELSKEKIGQLKALFKKYKNTAHVTELADGEIEGAPAYRWSVSLDKTQLARMLKEFSDLQQKNLESAYQQEVTLSDIENFLKLIDIKSMELLIQKKDYLPAQVKFSAEIMDETGKDIGAIDLSAIISGSNPVDIQAPAESTDILYLMGPIVQSSLETARQKGKEAAIKANLSTMRAQAELFYDQNNPHGYLGFCLSQELKNARKAIEDAGGTGFTCKDQSQVYAIAAKLPQNLSYWCVDSTGANKATTTLPSSTVCPVK